MFEQDLKPSGSLRNTPIKKSIGTPTRVATPTRKSTATKTPLKPFVVGKVRPSPLPSLSSPFTPSFEKAKPIPKSTPRFASLKPVPSLEPLVTPVNKVSIKTPTMAKKLIVPNQPEPQMEETPINNMVRGAYDLNFKINCNFVQDLSESTQLQRYAKNATFKFGTISTKLSPILLFTISECLAAKNAGNVELARQMFQILMNSSCNQTKCVEFDPIKRKYKPSQNNYSVNLEFYTEWLKFEQKHGDYAQILNVYLMATDNLKSVHDLRIIQEIFNTFNNRNIQSVQTEKRAIVVEDDLMSDQEYLKRIDSVIQREIKMNDTELYEMVNIKSETKSDFHEKKGAVEDIADILGNMKLEPDIENVKKPIMIEDDFHYSTKTKEQKPARQVCGVEMGTTGSRVTVLTPIKAKKKQQMGTFN